MSTTPPPAGDKKGLSGIAIAGIGCLGLVAVAGVGGLMLLNKGCQKVKEIAQGAGDNPGLMMARLAVAANPDLEIISTDESKGEITLKDKKSGQTITMPVSDLAAGKITVQDADGKKTTVDLSQAESGRMTVEGSDGKTTLSSGKAAGGLPAWIPAYPGLEPREGGISSESPDGVAGTHFFTSGDSVEKVARFYEQELKARGFEASAAIVKENGAATATLTALKGEDTTVNLIISPDEGSTVITLSFNGPRP